MKKVTIALAAIGCIAAAAIISCNSSDKPSERTEGMDAQVKSASADEPTKEQQIERGKYLTATMGCHDCHSPKKMGPMGPELDSARLLSGHPAGLPLGTYDSKTASQWVLFHPNLTAVVGPWGTSFSANITSDESGIGSWSEAQFLKCIREGKLKGMDNTRPLLPPMPWQMIAKASDEDLKAIFAYLKSTPPVANVVPAPLPPAGAPPAGK